MSGVRVVGGVVYVLHMVLLSPKAWHERACNVLVVLLQQRKRHSKASHAATSDPPTLRWHARAVRCALRARVSVEGVACVSACLPAVFLRVCVWF